MLTLLWGLPADSPFARVREELDQLGAPVWLLDQRDVLDTEVELEAGTAVGGHLRVGGRRLDLTKVTAAYVRPYDACRLPRVAATGLGSDAWQHAADVDEAISCWLELTDALVVNRLSAMAGNGSKPWQLRRIETAGFAVPETIVTTEPQAARSFWDCHGEVIYKSVSGVRSRVARLRPDDACRLADIAACPTQLQQYVPGTDVRVHVIGRQVLATEITSDADDYRYAAEQGRQRPELAARTLPPEVEDRCRRLAAALDLAVAGIDLRVTPDGTWYCFEVNPSPAFSYYEGATGQPIARAIACLLVAGGAVCEHGRRHATRTGTPAGSDRSRATGEL
jgi:RimK-like ATP-grasp domain